MASSCIRPDFYLDSERRDLRRLGAGWCTVCLIADRFYGMADLISLCQKLPPVAEGKRVVLNDDDRITTRKAANARYLP